MKKAKEYRLDSNDDIVQGLELLRCHVVDLEAMAYAASQTLEHIPNVSALSRQIQDSGSQRQLSADVQLQLGRLQALVMATANASHAVLLEINALLDKAHDATVRKKTGSNGHGSSQAGEIRQMYHIKGCGFHATQICQHVGEAKTVAFEEDCENDRRRALNAGTILSRTSRPHYGAVQTSVKIGPSLMATSQRWPSQGKSSAMRSRSPARLA